MKRYVAYHGENPDRPIARFVEASRTGELYLAFDPFLAAEYGQPVYKVTVVTKKPLEIETPAQFVRCWEVSGAATQPPPFHPNKTCRLAEWARGQGFDVLVLQPSAFEGEEGYREVAGRFGEPQLVVLDANAIRQCERLDDGRAAVTDSTLK